MNDELRRLQVQLLIVTQQRNQALDELARVTAQLVLQQEQSKQQRDSTDG